MTLQNHRDSETSLRRHSSPQRFLIPFLIASCSGSGHPPGSDASVVPVLVPAAVAQAAPAPVPAAPPDLTGVRTAIDLVANRVHAVAHRDGRLTIDAGGLDFIKYVDGGWKTSWLLGEKDEGKPASLVAGLSALVNLPVDADGDGGGSGVVDSTLSLTMRGLANQQRVSVFVNEKPVGTVEVAATTKRYDVAVPAALLHVGDNRLRLTFRSAADVAGGKRSAAALTAITSARRRWDCPPPRFRPPPCASSTSAARAGAGSPRAATRGSRSSCSCRRAPRWRWPKGRRPRAARRWCGSPSTVSRPASSTRRRSRPPGPMR